MTCHSGKSLPIVDWLSERKKQEASYMVTGDGEGWGRDEAGSMAPLSLAVICTV